MTSLLFLKTKGNTMENMSNENVNNETKETKEISKLTATGFIALGVAVGAAAVWGIKWLADYIELSSIELIED